MKNIRVTAVSILAFFSVVSCVSVEDIVMGSAADMLSSDSGAANIFTMDDDPQLIADALPLALKLYEMVLASDPEHSGMQYATGKNFVMYANAFIQTPAGMLPDEEYMEQERMLNRAKKMYIRGRDYILTGIELEHPGFLENIDEGRLDQALLLTDKPGDAAMLYWAASGWVAAFSCNPFDFEFANDLYIPVAMLYRALQLDESFSRGSIHDIFIQIYSSLPYGHVLNAFKAAPETAGAFNEDYYAGKGVPNEAAQKTDFHFNRAIELAGGMNPGTYCSYAASVSVKKQDYKEYRQLLEKALAIDPSAEPENELVTTIYQEKAEWMLENAENFFIDGDF